MIDYAITFLIGIGVGFAGSVYYLKKKFKSKTGDLGGLMESMTRDIMENMDNLESDKE